MYTVVINNADLPAADNVDMQAEIRDAACEEPQS